MADFGVSPPVDFFADFGAGDRDGRVFPDFGLPGLEVFDAERSFFGDAGWSLVGVMGCSGTMVVSWGLSGDEGFGCFFPDFGLLGLEPFDGERSFFADAGLSFLGVEGC